MRYQILDNGKPADCHHYSVHSSWVNSTFKTYEDAVLYAIKWLGWDWCDTPEDINALGNAIRKDVYYDYSGYGDFLEIREVD